MNRRRYLIEVKVVRDGYEDFACQEFEKSASKRMQSKKNDKEKKNERYSIIIRMVIMYFIWRKCYFKRVNCFALTVTITISI